MSNLGFLFFSRDSHVSNITVELRKLIQMIIQTNFLLLEKWFQKLVLRVSSGFLSKTIKALGLRPRAFISFLAFETPVKQLHSFLKYYITHTWGILTRFDIKFLGNVWGFHRGLTWGNELRVNTHFYDLFHRCFHSLVAREIGRFCAKKKTNK